MAWDETAAVDKPCFRVILKSSSARIDGVDVYLPVVRMILHNGTLLSRIQSIRDISSNP